MVACAKRRFFYRDDAKHEAKRLGRKNRVMLHVYHCSVCNFWHLTKRAKHEFD